MKKKILVLAVFIIMALSMLCGCFGGNGKIYLLQEAYEQGLITKEDLERIASINNNGIVFTEELDGKIETAIKKAEAKYLREREGHPVNEAKAEHVTIAAFYGVYSNCYIVSTESIYIHYPTDVPNYWIEIGGVEFHITWYHNFRVWKEK